MAQLNPIRQQLFLRHFLDAIRRRPVVHHLGFGPRVGVFVALRAGATRLLWSGHHVRLTFHRLRSTTGQHCCLPIGFHGKALLQCLERLVVAVLVDRLLEQVAEFIFDLRQVDAILRALWPRHARLDRGKVELKQLAVFDLAGLRHPKHALSLKIGPERVHLRLRPPGSQEIVARLFVHREEAHGRAILRRHVADRRPVGQRQAGRARAMKLNKLADDFGLAQHFGNLQHQVGGGNARLKRARQVHAHDVGRKEIHGLAQHPCLGLDAAHAPAHDTQAVDHRGVRVGSDDRVRIIHAVLLQHAFRQVFQVDLMDNADARRHHAETIERLRAPLEQLVAGAVALELDLHVELERVVDFAEIYLHRMVYDQINRHKRLDNTGIFAHSRSR